MNFITSTLKGLDGHISSKRLVTMIAFTCIVIAFLVNVFTSIPLQEHVYDGMLYLVMGGMGFSSFEKFSPKHAHEKNEDTNE
tara:strand:+ start:1062 stop:1307 length:246 start_codon:yes stop_codon:yes gene_type:complete